MQAATHTAEAQCTSATANPPLRLTESHYLDLSRPTEVIKSTITIVFSCDGRHFASTHGDKTVKVFSYPDGVLRTVLHGHPRTPWAACFHPKLPNLLATGCLAGECRIWNIESGQCVAVRRCPSTVACLTFHPQGNLLAIATNRTVITWRCMEGLDAEIGVSGSDIVNSGAPQENVLLTRSGVIHLVEFNSEGSVIMVGVKNERTVHPTTLRQDQFTLNVSLHGFHNDRENGSQIGGWLLHIPHVVAYNQAGVHISTCGRMLAACIQSSDGDRTTYHICVLSLVQIDRNPVGTVLHKHALDSRRVSALTTLKFSPTGRQLLAAYSLVCEEAPLISRRHTYAGDTESLGSPGVSHGNSDADSQRTTAVEIYSVSEQFEVVQQLKSIAFSAGGFFRKVDRVNVALFAPRTAGKHAVLYGTTEGRVRMFTSDGY